MLQITCICSLILRLICHSLEFAFIDFPRESNISRSGALSGLRQGTLFYIQPIIWVVYCLGKCILTVACIITIAFSHLCVEPVKCVHSPAKERRFHDLRSNEISRGKSHPSIYCKLCSGRWPKWVLSAFIAFFCPCGCPLDGHAQTPLLVVLIACNCTVQVVCSDSTNHEREAWRARHLGSLCIFVFG